MPDTTSPTPGDIANLVRLIVDKYKYTIWSEHPEHVANLEDLCQEIEEQRSLEDACDLLRATAAETAEMYQQYVANPSDTLVIDGHVVPLGDPGFLPATSSALNAVNIYALHFVGNRNTIGLYLYDVVYPALHFNSPLSSIYDQKWIEELFQDNALVSDSLHAVITSLHSVSDELRVSGEVKSADALDAYGDFLLHGVFFIQQVQFDENLRPTMSSLAINDYAESSIRLASRNSQDMPILAAYRYLSAASAFSALLLDPATKDAARVVVDETLNRAIELLRAAEPQLPFADIYASPSDVIATYQGAASFAQRLGDVENAEYLYSVAATEAQRAAEHEGADHKALADVVTAAGDAQEFNALVREIQPPTDTQP